MSKFSSTLLPTIWGESTNIHCLRMSLQISQKLHRALAIYVNLDLPNLKRKKRTELLITPNLKGKNNRTFNNSKSEGEKRTEHLITPNLKRKKQQNF